MKIEEVYAMRRAQAEDAEGLLLVKGDRVLFGGTSKSIEAQVHDVLEGGRVSLVDHVEGAPWPIVRAAQCRWQPPRSAADFVEQLRRRLEAKTGLPEAWCDVVVSSDLDVPTPAQARVAVPCVGTARSQAERLLLHGQIARLDMGAGAVIVWNTRGEIVGTCDGRFWDYGKPLAERVKAPARWAPGDHARWSFDSSRFQHLSYTLGEGDTLAGLAAVYLGSSERWNELRRSHFDEATYLVGEKLRMPLDAAVRARCLFALPPDSERRIWHMRWLKQAPAPERDASESTLAAAEQDGLGVTARAGNPTSWYPNRDKIEYRGSAPPSAIRFDVGNEAQPGQQINVRVEGEPVLDADAASFRRWVAWWLLRERSLRELSAKDRKTAAAVKRFDSELARRFGDIAEACDRALDHVKRRAEVTALPRPSAVPRVPEVDPCWHLCNDGDCPHHATWTRTVVSGSREAVFYGCDCHTAARRDGPELAQAAAVRAYYAHHGGCRAAK